MKKISKILLIMTLVLLFIPTVVSANTVDKNSIVGSWYGQYTGSVTIDDWYSQEDIDVNRYMNMTITECDDYGNITGEAYVTTVKGQGYDHQWIKYNFKGTIDFTTRKFFMQGVEKIACDETGNWSFARFDGSLSYNANGEMYVQGIVEGYETRTFYFGKVSEWAKDEITEANTLKLIPETMKNKDLSKPITRAEFAAVANQLYEKLSGQPTIANPSTFTDITGDPDEESIKKAHTLNITVGYSDKIFAPNEYISREQLATMLTRTIKKHKFPEWTFATDSYFGLDYSGMQPFADDVYIADYARESVYYMAKMGIINGFEGNIFAPKNITQEDIANNYATATREQALALALRIFKLSNGM